MTIHTIEGIPFTLVRCRRRTLCISVHRDGSVHVRVPWLTTTQAAYAFVTSRLQWIRAHLHQPAPPRMALPEEAHALAQLKAAASARFAALAAPWVARFKQVYGVAPARWTVRNMKTRWGSCSGTNRITLNLQLYTQPDACCEYVIVHELCHLVHRNHGPLFHQMLANELPDWKERRKELNHKK